MTSNVSIVSVDVSAVTDVYVDGGVVKKNPSPFGGTWAFVLVGADGKAVWDNCGRVDARDHGKVHTSNNFTEFYAVLMALSHLPDGWSGRVHSDSLCTIRSFGRSGPVDYMTEELVKARDREKSRLGKIDYVLVGGHPTRHDLVRGFDQRGLPVSKHNVRCDELCRQQAVVTVELANANPTVEHCVIEEPDGS